MTELSKGDSCPAPNDSGYAANRLLVVRAIAIIQDRASRPAALLCAAHLTSIGTALR